MRIGRLQDLFHRSEGVDVQVPFQAVARGHDSHAAAFLLNHGCPGTDRLYGGPLGNQHDLVQSKPERTCLVILVG